MVRYEDARPWYDRTTAETFELHVIVVELCVLSYIHVLLVHIFNRVLGSI